MRRAWLLLLMCLLSCADVYGAGNPRVSLRLRQVTCAEAAAALEKTTGEAVSLMEIPVSRTPGIPRVELSERADWDWTNATLADALRQLAQRYRLSVSGGLTGYHLIPRLNANGDGPPEPRGRWEGHGVKIGVTSAGWNRSGPGSQRITVQFSVETTGLEGDRLAALTNVSARDNLGNILTADERVLIGKLRRQYPDTFACGMDFPNPPEIGSRLEWIEGEVALYPTAKRRTLSFVLPQEKGSDRASGGFRVHLQEVLPGRLNPPEDVIAAQGMGPAVSARITLPALVGRAGDFLERFQAVLVGASGKHYLAGMHQMSLVGELGDSTYDSHWQFSAIREGLSRVEFHYLDAEEPMSAFRFRIKDVPLPAANADTDRGTTPFRGLFAAKAWGPDQPYFAAGGAVLLLPVVLSGRSAPAGVLSLGLSRKGPDGLEPTHWISTRLGAGGAARIEGLAPGTYRLLRHFRTDAPPVNLPPGRWRNTEVTIAVGAGLVRAPALEWAPEAAR